MSNVPTPFAAATAVVLPQWIDLNGHMNVGYYHVAFDVAAEPFFEFLGFTPEFRKRTGASTFALESHLSFVRELKEGDPIRYEARLLDFDRKRLHFYQEMFHGTEGWLAATYETLSVHVDMTQRRTAPMPEELHAQARRDPARARDAAAALAGGARDLGAVGAARRRTRGRHMKSPFARLAAFALALAAAQPAAAQDKVVFATNWKAQAAHGGFYQALADGTYGSARPGREIRQGGPQVNNRPLLPAGKHRLPDDRQPAAQLRQREERRADGGGRGDVPEGPAGADRASRPGLRELRRS